MANFAVSNSTLGGTGTQQAMATAYKTVCAVYASTTGTTSLVRRGKIYDLLVGTNASVPADNSIEWSVGRLTAPSTGSLVSANPLDPADAAMASGSIANSTTEGTFTSSGEVFYVGVNQRASYRWVAAPGSELVYPATSSAGLGLRARSPAYTGTVTGTIYNQEQ
jgi:hypothetical protein